MTKVNRERGAKGITRTGAADGYAECFRHDNDSTRIEMDAETVHILILLVGGCVMLLLLVRSVNTSVRTGRKRGDHRSQARRHFVRAATLMEEAKKASTEEARSLVGTAMNEADIAIELDPEDAALHLVKSLALEQLGKPAAAVKVLDVALSPKLTRSFSKIERADTLVKRAELLLVQGGGVLEALVDLQDALKLGSRNPRLYLMLGRCYEKTGNSDKAVEAFRQCLLFDPFSPEAKAGIDRNVENSRNS
ncbi:hypothetical protein R1sor_003827 [Riccia sorocarpa]|uniref:Tetratricopeptide repeat protein n=1 Tax=Riccia sorocarpa TaxID=122646 RepID=A0ABD3H668_9MARC